jgi:NADH:ubiquinone oxidoreductase subunit C
VGDKANRAIRKIVSKPRNFWLVNPETGEVMMEGVKVMAFIPSQKEKENFDKVFKTLWVDLLANEKLKGSQLKVLAWLISQNKWNNDWIAVDYEEVAKATGLKIDTVRKAFKTLRDAGFIIQKAPRKPFYRLNPKYVFQGLASCRAKDIDF